jgi:hypothetical protein
MDFGKYIDLKDKTIMHFIINAIEDGWSVKKRQDSYIFSKKHEGNSQVFQEGFLQTFINKYHRDQTQ